MLKGILVAALTAEQRKRGFSLIEPDARTLRLLYQGEPVAHFSSRGATVAEIRATADRIAKKDN